MTRILVADDHSVVRQGLRQILALTTDLQFAGEAVDGWGVIEQVRRASFPFDLLLLDMSMPGPSGVDLIKRLHKEEPRLPILVLSMHAESQVASRAIKAGASGYLTKDADPDALIAAIRQVAAGGQAVDQELATRMIFESSAPETDAPHRLLSDREYEIFLRLAGGDTINDIAASFHISPKTVSTHKFRLMRKLGVESVSEMVRYALRHGLLE